MSDEGLDLVGMMTLRLNPTEVNLLRMALRTAVSHRRTSAAKHSDAYHTMVADQMTDLVDRIDELNDAGRPGWQPLVNA